MSDYSAAWCEENPGAASLTIERLRLKLGQAEKIAKLLPESAAEIERLRAALTVIACYDDKGANKHLLATGSFGAFDEPASVEIARAALEQ